MNLRYLQTIAQPAQGIKKVTACCWSLNGKRLAVVTTDRVVHLFDENGDKRDKFSTKPYEKGFKDYIVRAMAFSPDEEGFGTRLAVAQSDNVVFVYKLGKNHKDKKSICNKFPTGSRDQGNRSVTSLTWRSGSDKEVFFGLADGKVKVGVLRNNKAITVFTHPERTGYVVSMCSSPDGSQLAVGYLDNSVALLSVPSPPGASVDPAMITGQIFLKHSTVPYALAWGESIVAAGNDRMVTFYDSDNGVKMRNFDYREDESVRGFGCAAVNPTGQAIVLGNFDRFFVYQFDRRAESWEQVVDKKVKDLYSVTALAWNPDGSRVAVGNLCGSVTLFDACIRRVRYKGRYDFRYVSPSQVIVTELGTGGKRFVVTSTRRNEITKLNVYQNRFIVANTSSGRRHGGVNGFGGFGSSIMGGGGGSEGGSTLLVGDMDSGKLSEVPWGTVGKERFHFENESVAMVYKGGELSIIEYGRNEFLGSCRTEFMSPYLISCRINERPPPAPFESGFQVMAGEAASPGGRGGSAEGKTADATGAVAMATTLSPAGAKDAAAVGAAAGAAAGFAARSKMQNKKIAFLLDAQTIRVDDLHTGETVATVYHDVRVDFLELNGRAHLLLFRDKLRRLHLYDIRRGESMTLLNYCSYVQWVPDSDVVVAQNRGSLCVWYNIKAPQEVEMIAIKGDVEEIIRANGKTVVVVDPPGGAILDGDIDGARVAELEEKDGAGGGDGDDGDGGGGGKKVYHIILEESKIAFGTATEDGDFATAIRILEGLEQQASETRVMWEQLFAMAMATTFHNAGAGQLAVAERCAAALGDVSKVRYLRRLNKVAASHAAKFLQDSEQLKAAKENRDVVAVQAARAQAQAEGYKHWDVRARLALMAGDSRAAERCYVRNGQGESAIVMYQMMHHWEDAIEVARSINYGGSGEKASDMQREYIEFLINSGQQAKAARAYEQEGNAAQAIDMFLAAGFPVKAAQVLLAALDSEQRGGALDQRMVTQWKDEIVEACEAHGMLVEVGKFHEALGRHDKALESYISARSETGFRKAVELARKASPGRVVELERSWGDWLCSVGQYNDAINHYVEAGDRRSALRAAFNKSRPLFKQAEELLAALLEAAGGGGDGGGGRRGRGGRRGGGVGGMADDEAAAALSGKDGELYRECASKLARHFANKKSYEEGARYFILAGAPQDAVRMYTSAGLWREAERIIDRCRISDEDMAEIYLKQGAELEVLGEYKQAEKCFLLCGEWEKAAEMYLSHQRFDDYIRLIGRHRPTELDSSRLQLAQRLEKEGNFQKAEKLYCEGGSYIEGEGGGEGKDDDGSGKKTRAGDEEGARDEDEAGPKPGFHRAVHMYRVRDMWMDAIRVARERGGEAAASEVAYAWAVSLPDQRGLKKLMDLGLVGMAIDYAMEKHEFKRAFAIARQEAKHKVPEVHLKYAMYLEDSHNFREAEKQFVEAHKPTEAIDMYKHQSMWDDALRVATAHDPGSVPDVHVARGKFFEAKGMLQKAENIYVQELQRPELAMQMYQRAKDWKSAERVCKTNMPDQLQQFYEIKRAHGGGGNALDEAQAMLDRHQWEKAVHLFLSVSASSTGGDEERMAYAWQKAARVAAENYRSSDPGEAAKLERVVLDVAKKLESIRHFEAAGDLYADFGKDRDAARSFVAAAWAAAEVAVQGGASVAEASAAASSIWAKANDESLRLDQRERQSIQQQYKKFCKRYADAVGLVSAGSVSQGLGVLVQQGKWDDAFAVCREKSPEELPRFALLRASEAMGKSPPDIDVALETLNKYGVPRPGSAMDPDGRVRGIVQDLARALLNLPKKECVRGDDDPGNATPKYARMVKNMRAILYEMGSSGRLDKQLEKLLFLFHFMSLRITAQREGLHRLGACIALSCIRFVQSTEGVGLPVDRALYDAGWSCKTYTESAAGKRDAMCSVLQGVALAILDQFTTVDEWQDENMDELGIGFEGKLNDGAPPVEVSVDLDGTEIAAVLKNAAMPRGYFLSEAEREEVRTYVVQISLNGGGIGDDGAAALSAWFPMRRQQNTCMVSGFVIGALSEYIGGGGATVKLAGGNIAERASYNEIVAITKQDPWTGEPTNPVY